MRTDNISSRRQFVRAGGVVLFAIPILAVTTPRASAATNAAVRASLKYQDTPNGDKDCAGCAHFIPGKSATGPGSCQVIPGDTEISPKGYCIAWTAKPK